VNIILFSAHEVELPLSRQDDRARHILNVLRRNPGESCDVGMINGPRGKATLTGITERELSLSFTWGEKPAPLVPIHLLVGLPRPQTARDLLRESATVGIARLTFVFTERSEPSYAQSSLWSTGEWHRLLVAGAAQAFCTRIPEVRHALPLDAAIATIIPEAFRIALDNYAGQGALSQLTPASAAAVTLAVGAERGWTDAERMRLQEHDFVLAHLGSRVLRTETACVAAIMLLKAKLGWL
jgi:16S rRNA (uracil1498-N3)-methyltransferase